MLKIEIKENFIYFLDIDGHINIINKNHIINVSESRFPEHIVIHLCYPGMRETSITAKLSMNEFWGCL